VPRGTCPSDSCPSTTSRPPPVRPWPLLATYRPVTQPRPSTDLHRPRNRGLRAFPAGLATTPRPHHPLLCRRAPQPAPAQERSRCCVPNARGFTLARARSPPNHADCRYRVTCVCTGARLGRSPVPRRVSRRPLAERSSSGSRAATLSPLSRRRRGPAPALSSRRSRPSTITRAPPPTGGRAGGPRTRAERTPPGPPVPTLPTRACEDRRPSRRPRTAYRRRAWRRVGEGTECRSSGRYGFAASTDAHPCCARTAAPVHLYRGQKARDRPGLTRNRFVGMTTNGGKRQVVRVACDFPSCADPPPRRRPSRPTVRRVAARCRAPAPRRATGHVRTLPPARPRPGDRSGHDRRRSVGGGARHRRHLGLGRGQARGARAAGRHRFAAIATL
jgi:hypothetical protein